jgi:hypothetical protein
MASGILYCGTSSKDMHRIMKCLLILITVYIIIYNIFFAFLTLAHDISYVERVWKFVFEWLHIRNWKYLNIFIPKASRRSGEAIARKNKLIMFPKLWLALSQVQTNELWHTSNFRLKDVIFFTYWMGIWKTTRNRSEYSWTNWTSEWNYSMPLKTTFLGKSGPSHMNSLHYIKNVYDHIHINIYLFTVINKAHKVPQNSIEAAYVYLSGILYLCMCYYCLGFKHYNAVYIPTRRYYSFITVPER